MTVSDPRGSRDPRRFQRDLWRLRVRGCLCSNPRSLTIGTRDGDLVRVCGLCWKRLSAVE